LRFLGMLLAMAACAQTPDGEGLEMKWAILFLMIPALAWTQSRGENVFAQSCATVYCHGAKGAPAVAEGSAWRHSAVIAYSDAEFSSILGFLREAIK